MEEPSCSGSIDSVQGKDFLKVNEECLTGEELLYCSYCEKSFKYGVLRKLKHIFPNTYQRIKSIRSPAKGGTGCYRFNYQPGS